MEQLHIELQEAKADIMYMQTYIAHLEASNKEAQDEIQDLKKKLQKAKDFEKVAEAALESMSNGRR